MSQQFRDDKFNEALASLRYKTAGPWILAMPRSDLDPTSKARFGFSDMAAYKLNAKDNVVAVMHVMAKGPGRVRLGYREHIPVEVGDLVLVNLREAGHWITLDGRDFYLFTGDVPFARVVRTSKPETAPQQYEGERDDAYRERRLAWADEWFWNISDVLSDYVLLGHDPVAARQMMQGPETLIERTQKHLGDGVRSDDGRENRFPIVYRRVMGVGPGKWLTRESDLGIVEREETKSEARPGHMLAMSKTLAAAAFTFQGAPFEVIHAASVLVIETSEKVHYAVPGGTRSEPLQVEVDGSVAKPLSWVDPDDTEAEEDPDPPPEKTEG
jgi:hypothetical protein